jgi:hypothetical protein
MVNRTSSGGVISIVFGVIIDGKTPRASAHPFQT